MRKGLLVTWIACMVLLTGCKGLEMSAPGPVLATISVEGNPTAGFEWNASISDTGVLQEMSSTYVENDDGISGMYSWTFEAIKPGTVEVTLAYGRSFTDIEPVEWLTYSFIVDGEGTLHLDDMNGSQGTVPEPVLSIKE